MTVYAQPGTDGSKVTFKDRYENWIGGEWVAPVKGQYFENITPVTGKAFCEVALGTAEDIELALDAAHKIAPSWGKTSVAERAAILNKIADRIDENLEMLAVAESWDNGKPIRETLNADIPLAADHFRYFASAVRAQEGRLSQLDDDTTAYHFHEPLGVVGQIIPWNFPILMAVWKLAPALAAGNAVVLKPAEQTPSSILVLMELIGDLLPAGVVNVVNGFGVEAGKPLASSPRIRKIAFTGETTTGRLISQYASQNLIPVTLEQEPQHLLQRCGTGERRVLRQGAGRVCAVRVQPGGGLHLPVPRPGPGGHLRIVHGGRRGPGGKDDPGQPAGHRNAGGRPGLQRPARKDPVLHRHRKAGGRQDPHRRGPCGTAW
jgi:aldehyde dehydrogenase